MSTILKTLNHGELNNCGFCKPHTAYLRVGDYEIPTREFAGFAAYVLSGGKQGWQKTPPYIMQAVSKISQHIEIPESGLDVRLAKCRLCEYPEQIGEKVRIGKYEIKTEEFARFATHIIVGGIFGWKETPPYITKAAQELYKKVS